MGLLHRAGKNTFDADAVAPHDGRDFFTIAIEYAGAHRLGILITEFEYVTDLDRLGNFEHCAAAGASLSFADIAQVGVFGHAEVAAGSHVLQMEIFFIRAGDKILASLERHIGVHERQTFEQDLLCLAALASLECRNADWAEVSGRSLEDLL